MCKVEILAEDSAATAILTVLCTTTARPAYRTHYIYGGYTMLKVNARAIGSGCETGP